MKKILAALASSVLILASATSQVLDKEQMKNTAWAGVGSPLNGDPVFYGFTDTFQARFDRGKFTIEGMLNWGFLANYDYKYDIDNFVFGTSNLNPLSIKYGVRPLGGNAYGGTNSVSGEALALDGSYDNRANVSNTIQDSYYINFLYHPTKNVDLGVGTKLNWQVGPAPKYGSWLWEHDAHVRQGGFSTSYDDRSGAFAQTSTEAAGSYKFHVDRPGTADVVGFVPYANKYAKRAAGVRYISTGDYDLQIGAAIPNGFNTDDPAVNLGAQIGVKNVGGFAAAIEGLFEKGANFYSGATFGIGLVTLDLYLAIDSLFTKEKNDQAYGTGAAAEFTIPDTKFKLRPEAGINFFENSDYTPSFYTGGTFAFGINKQIGFNLWGSFAIGSKDKTWKDNDATKDWKGGHIIDIRPEITFDFSEHTTLAAYFDWEDRKAFDGTSRSCWATGVFWTYIF